MRSRRCGAVAFHSPVGGCDVGLGAVRSPGVERLVEGRPAALEPAKGRAAIVVQRLPEVEADGRCDNRCARRHGRPVFPTVSWRAPSPDVGRAASVRRRAPQGDRDETARAECSCASLRGGKQNVFGDEHAQGAGVHAKLERRLELESLAVDAGEGLAAARAHLEGRRCELVQMGVATAQADRAPGDHGGGLAAAGGVHGEDPEEARVHAPPLGDVERRAQDVRVVRHHDQERVVDLDPVGRGELQVERFGAAAEHRGEQLP